ncbi:conserved hypothetical protein [Culex quinquefasciatus]|uniref:Uncharacterized protein n=1 Tax=Culex quinquefasciatus TaxID=7176 RepID=B0XK06_CULQU|nr:conserved hypothetical protein [Culex quinquefasciatus]|eukprot:XP_001869978.1 conserved hypothetical protein [Culex quinquefasciatus]
MGKKKANQLGRSLIKDRFGQGNRKTVDNNSMLHTTEVQDGYDWGRLNLQSVTEESSFQEFLRTAELAGTEFQAEKLNITYVNPKAKVGLLTTNERVAIERKQVDKKNLLKIPRRPRWTKETTPEELQLLENENFLEWRRGLAALQEDDGLLMTPYEKNLDFWRQLWRVVERSDIVVQIVDGRNPLLFRSEDLEKYVKEVDERKMNMILINKSDFLNVEQREAWAKYFDEQGIRVAFFSAAESVEEAKREQEERERAAEEVEQTQYHRFPERQKEEIDVKLLPPRQQRAMKMGTTTGKDIDSQFFQDRAQTGFVKGRSDFPNIRPSAVGVSAEQQQQQQMPGGVMIAGKPWKHQKREKKEKLRRKYAHLDQH